MSTWGPSASISTRITLSDIVQAKNSPEPPTHETPTLQLVSESREKGYDSVCLPLTTDAWKKRWTDMCILPDSKGDEKRKRESRRESRIFVGRDTVADKKAEKWRENPCFELDEVTITRLDEALGVTAIISEWLELDTEDDWIRCDAEIALQQELAYASYLNIQTAILPPPRNREYVSSYARIINACLRKSPYMNLAVRLPVYDPHAIQEPSSPTVATSGRSSAPGTPRIPPGTLKLVNPAKSIEAQIDAAWEVWDLIRTICEYNTRLSLALDLGPPLPNSLSVLSKWSAEAVRYIFLPASTFIANAKGYPVLPKPTQTFIKDSMAHRPNIVLANVASGVHARGGEDAYSQYIRHLESTSPIVQATKKTGTVENFAQGYQDFLQAPLQVGTHSPEMLVHELTIVLKPLMDNLHSITYETFEQDPVKYRNYEEAVYRALLDLPQETRIVICVAGAGRGPLVARSLKAVERSSRDAFIYALEKNPNAFVTLQQRLRSEWQGKVELIFGDMRQAKISEKADILVSELLGSFGDNELSPECLDGAMRFLKPGGISIPSSYTAHLAPLSSSKLYNEARSVKELKSLETPYVVMFQAVSILSGDGGGVSGKCGPKIQECWEFEHPRRDVVLDERGLPPTNTHNTRSAKLSFHIPHAGVLHGLAGYFEAVLYGNIGLSIHPLRKDSISKDMLSWFPLFFPLREPLYLPSNSELHVSIWRLTNQRQVWYEWHAESFLSIQGATLEMSTGFSTPSLGSTPRANILSMSPSPAAPSPLIDAIEIPLERKTQKEDSESSRLMNGLLKIGHTGLHNADGRSSWM
ncbi:hypothetical protein V5O48_011747, partial [Marasmius crinis-equi]